MEITNGLKVEKKEDNVRKRKMKEMKKAIVINEIKKSKREIKKEKFIHEINDHLETFRVKIRFNKLDKVIGKHVATSKGLEYAVINAAKMGCQSFSFFTRSQRTWKIKPLENSAIDTFKKMINIFRYDKKFIIPHGSYLMNCGSPKQEHLNKSRDILLEEVRRCELLGLLYYNFHPGSCISKISVHECIKNIAESINIVISKTKNIILVIETTCGHGTTIGKSFEEIQEIISFVHDKSRIGVCIDTCHIFAAGYNITLNDEYEKVMKHFDETIGFQYLKAIHANDSKGDLGCRRDRHADIGKGKIGIEGFRLLMSDSRFNNIPIILETPRKSPEEYQKEVELLYSLIK